MEYFRKYALFSRRYFLFLTIVFIRKLCQSIYFKSAFNYIILFWTNGAEHRPNWFDPTNACVVRAVGVL